ncbi:MAG TPA: hypothetical protein VD948_08585 [Rhodothermales bacterium]|nr:hypothetical protein [Rhodothermales bacterium]
MGSSVVGAGGGTAFSSWKQTIDGAARAFSIHITGGDPSYGTPGQQQAELWAKRVFVTNDAAGGTVRFRYDGGAPTNGQGHELAGGDTVVLDGFENIRRFQALSTTTVAGTLQITAER